ncbi:sterol desaturase family protein [Sediminitomix flava]|uniref:Sterol desaturase/sphingolipid hydroxylase (Fatty acid hydroxylase superfamily) n=1 Tax=Sediminitomix flava TaxID=379075 RepID=A0A315Z6U5_SEDFL|nr:sterol desaturase family protein [Sediminitomix flava]PWJ40117.1 sterol desaturase/sphingolipid hydroxylase (fatty acid hydroxylase superfamily) [Sediminitomix flava]
MYDYWQTFLNGYIGYFNYLWTSITEPSFYNYFYALIVISLLVFSLEILKPWRENQPKFRKDFWLDFFYMIFNFFLFSLLIYNASSDVVVKAFNDSLANIGISNLVFISLENLPYWLILLIGFALRDFIQWNVHRLLHRVSWLWEFHKLHHSVKEMGFAAHLRYHWMETVVYRTIEYIPLALIGIGLYDFFYIHIFTIMIGHLNHANININYGPLRYIFNSPQMHIWHHAQSLPGNYKTGVNFGITLSIWDYLFKTDYIPYPGQNIELGFDGDEKYPKTFLKQITSGFSKSRK